MHHVGAVNDVAVVLVPPPCCCCHAHRRSLPACLPAAAATFIFQNPAIFEASSELGDITGLYMTDDEGTIQVRQGTRAGRVRLKLECLGGSGSRWLGDVPVGVRLLAAQELPQAGPILRLRSAGAGQCHDARWCSVPTA